MWPYFTKLIRGILYIFYFKQKVRMDKNLLILTLIAPPNIKELLEKNRKGN